MKNIIIIILSVFINAEFVFSQVPDNYYNNAEDLSGEELRTALFNIIKNHTQLTYDQLWTAFHYTDKKDDGKVWDIYSNCDYTFDVDKCGNYNSECDCYNREHLFPKSWFGGASPMYTDLFHLYPSDGWVNNKRGDFPFGEITTPTFTSSNGSKIGAARNGLGYTGTVFEPPDEYKGDFARSYFYMLTCYMDKNLKQSNSVMVSTNNNFETWAINMLLQWHRNDPVSEREIYRNNIIYNNYQTNRNPFIDQASFAEKIWNPNYVDNEPKLKIIYPANETITTADSIDIEFTLTNFLLGSDGKIAYKLNNSNYNFTTENTAIRIRNLVSGNNAINLKLVDMSGQDLYPNISKTVNIIYNNILINSQYYNKIHIYPNPAKENINIYIDDSDIENKKLEIYDIYGKLIYRKSLFSNKTTLNTETLQNGMYFIQIKEENSIIYVEKITVNK